MKGLIQRVRRASVDVDGETIAGIGHGLLVLVGVEPQDSTANADRLLHRLLHYRVFADPAGRMNLDVQQVAGELLLVSQFTLAADTRKGLRPGFSSAASPEQGRRLYQHLVDQARQAPIPVASGEYGADMQVALINDGPVTFLLDA